MKKSQQGVSLSGLLVVSALLATVALLGIKLAPITIEYFQIVKIVKTIANDPSVTTSVADIRRSFERRSQIDNVSSIGSGDLEIGKDGVDVVISFSYQKQIVLFKNVSLLIDFQGSSRQ